MDWESDNAPKQSDFALGTPPHLTDEQKLNNQLPLSLCRLFICGMPSQKPINSSEQGDDSLFVTNLASHQGAILGYLNTLLLGDPEVADIVKHTLVGRREKGTHS